MAGSDVTKSALAVAMKALMAEKPFVKIKIEELVAACGMNRSSFYYHFKDKWDLLTWIFDTEITAEIARLAALDISRWEQLGGLCNFFYADRAFYRNAFRVEGQNSFAEYFSTYMRALFAEEVRGMYDVDQQQDFMILLAADWFVQVMCQWLADEHDIPPEELVAMMRKADSLGASITAQENERARERQTLKEE